jgi:molybdopterin-guanine dinucleotide biosynthesis protein B
MTRAARSSVDVPRRPARLHIVGVKNAGKTTLVLELVGELTHRGYRVGTIKHSPHEHELDQPGTDSFRHREAGGSPSAFVTSRGTALFLPPSFGEDPYAAIEQYFATCDLVLVEGDLEARAPKFEVWRPEVNRPPLALGFPGVLAVISDSFDSPQVPAWPRTPLDTLTDRLLAHVPPQASLPIVNDEAV